MNKSATSHVETIMDLDGGQNTFWLCACGNDPIHEGFIPVDGDNHAVEPTPELWTVPNYACLSCGRIINQTNRTVVGQVDPTTVL